MKQSHQMAGGAIQRSNITAFGKVAQIAGERQILKFTGALMFSANHMINMMGQDGIGPMQETILTASQGTPLNRLA
jgi:hypothetical protein